MKFYKKLFFLFFLSHLGFISSSQNKEQPLLDSHNNRECYDFIYAHLNLEFLLEEQKIKGFNELYFAQKCKVDTLIIDLFDNLNVDSVLICDKKQNFTRRNNQIFISKEHCITDSLIVQIFYNGTPIFSKNPPWDGGFVWEKDSNNLDWVGVACQNNGASLWWPNKDDLSDEPDSMRMSFIVQKPYFIASNGQLDTIVYLDNHKRRFDWFVSQPINNYNITFNIGNYTHFQDSLLTESGILSLDYYVLPDNLFLAQNHFAQVKPMLSFFEQKFGPYPFYLDGYKLVETSYLGMEHQSCISYGNKFQKGYLGKFPGNMDFDFIIIHETAHEWWGNSVSMKNRQDMWIHEAFATYAEALYVEHLYGYDSMLIYLESQKKHILNQHPIVNHEHTTTDMYYKGSWMLHTLRTLLENDTLWFSILQGIQIEFKHHTIDGDDVVEYINNKSGYDFTDFFEQYLFQKDLPVFEYFFKKRGKKNFLYFKWNAVYPHFDMPILATINTDGYNWIYPNGNWKKIKLTNVNSDNFNVAENLFLLEMKNIK